MRCFINGIGRLDFVHLRFYLRLKFYASSIISSNAIYACYEIIILAILLRRYATLLV